MNKTVNTTKEKKMKLFFCLLLCFLTINGQGFLSSDRKYTFNIEDAEIKLVGASADDDNLEYNIGLHGDGLSIGGLYYNAKSDVVIDYKIRLSELIFEGEESSNSYSSWSWENFLQVDISDNGWYNLYENNETLYIEEEGEVVITLTKTIKTKTQDGALALLFTLNPKSGYSGVLDVTQNDVVFDVDIDLAKLSSYTSDLGKKGTLKLKGILETDQKLGDIKSDKETISLNLLWEDTKQDAVAINVAKTWECDDSTTLEVTTSFIENTEDYPDTEYNHVYEITWEMPLSFSSEANCLWDPVLSVNENSTYEAAASAGGEVKSNSVAIALGVSLSLIALIVIVVLIVVLVKRKGEAQEGEHNYDVR